MNSHHSKPPGLRYAPQFLEAGEARSLVKLIDREEKWTPVGGMVGARRVRQFGARYDHRRTAIEEKGAEAIPSWCQSLGTRIVEAGYLDRAPEQVIVNEYLPGQGISAHIDNPLGFGPAVVSITLGSAAMMDFHRPDPPESWSLYLEVGSLVALSGPARNEWKHGIAKRNYDMVEGRRIERGRRVSLTFRTLNARGAAT